MAEPLPYIIYLVIVQNISMFLMHLITVLLLTNTLYTKTKMLKNAEISPPFLVYLFATYLMAIVGLINSGYIICVWWKRTNDPLIIYITTSAVLLMLPIVSLAVFFLILHRILIITRFLASTNIHQWLLVTSIFSMFVLAGVTVAYYVWTWFLITPAPEINCWSVNCVTRFNGSIFSVWAKLVTGFFNSTVGSFFLYFLQKTQLRTQQPIEQINRKRANKLSLITIILEIVLNFIPAFIDLILRSTINLSLTQYVGVYTMFLGAADGTFVAILYSKNFGKLKSISKSTISTFRGSTSRISVSQVKLTVHK